MNDDKITTYKEFEIISRGGGFNAVPEAIYKIASFIVRKDDLIVCFAFVDNVLTRMEHPELKDKNLLEDAMKIIKEAIDNNKLINLEEYTFEYHPSNFIEVNNPKWWHKILRQYYE